MSMKTLADQISLPRTLSQTRKTMIFEMLLEQGCVTDHEQWTKNRQSGIDSASFDHLRITGGCCYGGSNILRTSEYTRPKCG